MGKSQESEPSQTSKTTVLLLENTRFQKSTLSPKSHKNDSQMTSKLIQNEPYGRQKTLPTPSRKRAENKHEKRTSKTLKNKPVSAREREARSTGEHCRTKGLHL